MNPPKKNPRDSPARIAGCSGHENDPPDPLLRACPTHAHGRPAGGLRGQRRAGLGLAVARGARRARVSKDEASERKALLLLAEPRWHRIFAQGRVDLGHGGAAIGLALAMEAFLMGAEIGDAGPDLG